METEDGTSNGDNTECSEAVQCLKGAAVNNGVADSNDVEKGAQRLDCEAVNNGVVIAGGNDVAQGDSAVVESFRTYKRRRHVKLNPESKAQEDCRTYSEAASRLAGQAVKKPCNVAVGNTLDKHSHAHWGNVVLMHLYQSLGDDKDGIEGCMREALMRYPKISCATTLKETCKIDKVGEDYSPRFELMSHRLRKEVNGHANVLCNGSCNESNSPDANEMCQRVLCNILVSEKFSSLCKVLIENFKGMKPESVFDFSIINSRLKEQAYEQSPTLFLSDIQQIWRKLQDTGNEIVSLAKGLSDMSRTFYCEQAGVSLHSTFKDGKQEESDSHMKPEQTEDCSMYKICTCRHCGNKANGKDCLVCDSCEEMFHISCIEPPVKEIPHKSWYCAKCTASGIGSPHENCVVCERLNDSRTLNFDENFPVNEETINELEENSNCTYDGAQASRRGEIDKICKVCKNEVDEGERIKVCGHSFCSDKYYHVRCLTSKQLTSYGPCWYCPSCLCQVCLTDKDDDQIVICDGCDDAYHIYCMKPARTSIPKGKWFCRKCDTGLQVIRRAKKVFESKRQRKTSEDGSKPVDGFEKNWNDKHGRDLDKGGGMDMLLTAANTLNLEEDLAAIRA
ncbi:PHD finger protein EHD3 [Prosopis cineraria]|uniref:PHD finger protein EHD3 n=1 Tax=Prosopis cineraria TaxID=364024 RepID=UPI0024109036|nr:PHD finger protein EHD3 [Prosopis cineraria]XP_054788537.1 PHD finger protein EHD3 [Prosopis cineraria]XP_054788538.1 PHD finger protein EHD3 [Prosopis cineraria]XP_054788539.1 PHD finger protein EHD3 [Prosopis cineraria]